MEPRDIASLDLREVSDQKLAEASAAAILHLATILTALIRFQMLKAVDEIKNEANRRGALTWTFAEAKHDSNR